MELSQLTPEQQSTITALSLKMGSLSFYAKFTHVETGPIITQYYFKPTPTSQLNKIMTKTEDLALCVGVESLIIQRQLDEISISVPNRVRTTIKFDSCLQWLSTDPSANLAKLPLLMGQTPTGNNFTLDLATQPHILIAGSTGSGKSVFLSQLITSLAVQRSPDELKLILVDTKQLDLTLFSSLDHVTEMVDKIDQLYDVMDALLREVRKRTETMKGICRNIGEWNSMGYGKQFPYYVLVIDELADVIGQDKENAKTEDKDSRRIRISDSIKSLAQISRASGIHIIAATQRPSIKVIDGDIKTNFPTRISFRLPTGFDSRVILDEIGAESLLGKGDYLYRTAQSSTTIRAHGSFVTMEDIGLVLSQHEYIRESFRFQREQINK
jgi:S-DNA-T family DNA segregation ATPase FtsK/SpoIIIE